MRKVLIWRKSAYYEKWRISHLRYRLYGIVHTLYTLLSELDFLFITVENFHSDLKNESSISSGFLFAKLEKIFLIFKFNQSGHGLDKRPPRFSKFL